MTSPELVPQLGAWSTGSGPLFRRLAAALKRLVDGGELAPGVRLPAERDLAETLGVSRTTVVNAYGVLRQEDLLDSRQGHGTWVADRPAPAPSPIAPATARSGAVVSRLTDGLAAAYDLTIATPCAHPLVDAAVEATAAAVADLHHTSTYEPAGLRTLREVIAERFDHLGVPTGPEQVLVTTGAAQGLWLALAAYTVPGDRVAVEDPTSPVILNILRNREARPVRVESDDYGLRPESLRRIPQDVHPPVVVVTPTYANPTSGVLPPTRREQLATYAAEHGTVVVEDLAPGDLQLGAHPPPPPVAAWAPEAPILSVGSMSKLFWWGLRVGWVRGPTYLLRRLIQLKTLVDLGTPVAAQAQTAWLIPRTTQVALDRRAELLPRLHRLGAELETRFPTWQWSEPQGGLSLWVRLPGGGGELLAQRSLREGVAFLSGRAFSLYNGHDEYIRLPFVLPEEDLASGMALLEQAWTHSAAGTGQDGTAASHPTPSGLSSEFLPG